MSNSEVEIGGVLVPMPRPTRGRRTKAGPRRTQAERSDETRARLLEAAAEVLRRKGYAGLRTDEVAHVAGVSRGAQQHHFPSKDSLVLATAAHLMRTGMQRGQRRAEQLEGEAIEGIIQDALDFFLGRDFSVMLDLVLAGSKDRVLREKIYSYTRESRLAVESAWLEVLCESGLPRAKAEKVLWLTISIVRGLAVRALWQRDDALFRSLLDEWKLILAGHLRGEGRKK
ncbi:transcriptional regulator, TetR family [Solimonas aquatica]|uniref:Transcriptional regulator, TetR family n=1 Tax=Solimonas aquatica TaxID=489703 RepID=A0A1H9BFL8_9GAMM|nr:TetR/AcrR family transcriptional regulator [Solimonas aquatica]SEP87810.1 transcriptional regulator, TetR family [Solimonas aquatica]